MDARHHAFLARTLLAACGGPDEVARLKLTRVIRPGTLYGYADPHQPVFMPADVIAELEAYCGEPLYSRALIECRPCAVAAADLGVEAQETTEVAADIQRLVRRASEDGRVSEAEKRRIEELLCSFDQQGRELRAAFERLCGGGS